MILEHDRPRAHLVVDDFFAPLALETIFAEIASLDGELEPGLVRDIGHDGQSVFFENPRRKNQAVWIHEGSKALRLFRERLWAPSMVEQLMGAREPLFQIIPNCWSPNLQISRYMTGDHYDFHEDEGAGVNLTAIVFLARTPSKVRGGDLVLAHDGAETTIRFRHNRLVIFPSKTLHRVTRVRVASDDPRDARISLQSWLAYGRPESTAKTKSGTHVEERPPEADRPTFLLAEEPIVRVAQALVDSPDDADLTPEELYWAAFYVSRILTQNLRWLAAEAGLAMSEPRIRRRGAGGDLDVCGRSRREGAPIDVGFSLRNATVAASEAVRLFVETGRGSTKRRHERLLPSGTNETRAIALFRRLLKASQA